MNSDQLSLALLQVSIALLVVAITAFINIRIKFAETATQAWKATAKILVWVITTIAAVASLYVILKELNSPAPLTKDSLGTILVHFFSFIFCVGVVGFMLLLELIEDLMGIQRDVVDHFHRLLDKLIGKERRQAEIAGPRE